MIVTKKKVQPKGNRVCFKIILWLSMFFWGFGCSTPYVQDELEEPVFKPAQEQIKREDIEYQLQTNDELEITFFYYPELDQTVVIRPDGFISLPLVGEIKAGESSCAKVRRDLVEKYSSILKEPEITVMIKKFTPQRVYVGGEVANPQVIELGKGKTTLQAIVEAGGFKDSAEMRNVLILRNVGQPTFRTIKVDMMKLFVSKRLVKNDLQLQATDVVYVPKTLINKVNQFVDQYMNKIVPNEVFTDLIRGK